MLRPVSMRETEPDIQLDQKRVKGGNLIMIFRSQPRYTAAGTLVSLLTDVTGAREPRRHHNPGVEESIRDTSWGFSKTPVPGV